MKRTMMGAALALMTLGCAPKVASDSVLPLPSGKTPLPHPVTLVLGSDSHDDLGLTARFIARANALAPELVIHAGDLQQFGSDAEWKAVDPLWTTLTPRWVVVPGNHEHRHGGWRHLAVRHGTLPRSLDVAGLHVVLLDDGAYRLGSQLAFLDRDLTAHARAHTVVVMHVPPSTARELGWLSVQERLPHWRRASGADYPQEFFDLPEPEATLFLSLVARHRVDAVISGHQHVHIVDRSGAVPILHLGTIGGLLPLLGEPHGFTLATLSEAGMKVSFEPLDEAPRGPLALIRSWLAYQRMARALRDAPN